MQTKTIDRRCVTAKAENSHTGIRQLVQGEAEYSSQTGVDDNLRARMLSVDNLMTVGLAVTGSMAFFTYWMTVTGDVASAALWDDVVAMQITDSE